MVTLDETVVKLETVFAKFVDSGITKHLEGNEYVSGFDFIGNSFTEYHLRKINPSDDDVIEIASEGNLGEAFQALEEIMYNSKDKFLSELKQGMDQNSPNWKEAIKSKYSSRKKYEKAINILIKDYNGAISKNNKLKATTNDKFHKEFETLFKIMKAARNKTTDMIYGASEGQSTSKNGPTLKQRIEKGLYKVSFIVYDVTDKDKDNHTELYKVELQADDLAHPRRTMFGRVPIAESKIKYAFEGKRISGNHGAFGFGKDGSLLYFDTSSFGGTAVVDYKGNRIDVPRLNERPTERKITPLRLMPHNLDKPGKSSIYLKGKEINYRIVLKLEKTNST